MSKVCIKCDVKFTNIEENFYKTGKTDKDGNFTFKGYCKNCCRIKNKERRDKLRSMGLSCNHSFKLGKAPYNPEKERIRRQKYKDKWSEYSKRQYLKKKAEKLRLEKVENKE